MARRLTTAEAAARLGVKPETLYAYVSRGLLARQRSARGSTFDAADVERMAATTRRRGAGGPRPMAFVTELTLIENGELRYRGLDAVLLSRERSFEAVASWLWEGVWDSSTVPWMATPAQHRAVSAVQELLDPGVEPIDRYTLAVAVAATADPLRQARSLESVSAAARAAIAVMVGALPRAGIGPAPMIPADRRGAPTVAERLWPRLSRLEATPERVAALDAALVLLADHELAASTLAARVAAAFGADPYAVIGTGLGAVSGVEHGAASLEVHTLFERAEAVGAARAVGDVARRLGSVPGLGMMLYPDGDPRGAELLRRGRLVAGRADRLAVVDEIVALSAARGLPAPNVDFGLGALAFVAEMVTGAGEAIFAPARVAGWIGHAREEYVDRTRFRARASYIGPRPDRSAESTGG